ncbi:ribonuclease D [soil metagenome]
MHSDVAFASDNSKRVVDSDEGLADLIRRSRTEGVVAVDTEFVWERTFFPQLGLVQLGFRDSEPELIDVPALSSLAPLGGLLADPDVVKLFHDAGQDLTILYRETGSLPRNVVDTQLAAGFAGFTATLSLQDLLQETVDIALKKTETRTNWLQRPLSEAQAAYALDDVRYLVAAYEHLLERLESYGRIDWMRDEMRVFENAEFYADLDITDLARKVKGVSIGRLSSREVLLLQGLAAWRESEARTRDLPRRRVLDDAAISEILRRKPTSTEELKRLRALDDRTAGRHGTAIARVVQDALEALDKHLPARPKQAPVRDDAFAARARLAQAFIAGRALGAGVDPTLVATRAETEEFVAAVDDGMDRGALDLGWRAEFAGRDLGRLLEGSLKIGVNGQGLPDTSE